MAEIFKYMSFERIVHIFFMCSKDGKTLVQYAFGKKEETIMIPEGVTRVGIGCLSPTMLDVETLIKQIYLPNSLLEIGERAFSEGAFTEITIPQSVKTIEEGAFSSCKNLQSIVLPDRLESLPDSCFAGCLSLKEIKIPSTVKSIGETCFSNCPSIKKISIPESVTKIGSRAFQDCSQLEEITISKNITELPFLIFAECVSLTKVVIPAGIEKIEKQPFYMCDLLETVYYEGSMDSWNTVEGRENVTTPVYFYSEDEPEEDGNFWHYNSEGEIEIWE